MQRSSGVDSELQAAQMEVDALLALNPRSPYGWAGQAELQLRAADLGVETATLRALEFAARAVREKPSIPDAHVALAESYRRLGCLKCAQRALQAAAQLAPGQPRILVHQALVLSDLGEPAALQQFQAALQGLPAGEQRAVARLIWAEQLVRRKELDAADITFQAAVADAPELLRAQLRYAAFLLYERGDAAGTIEAAKRANRIRQSIEAKRLQWLAEYLQWATQFEQTGKTGELGRVVERAVVTPEEAFVTAAAHPRITAITRALGKAKAVPNVNVRDGGNNTALIAASRGGDLMLVKTLLDLGADANAQNSLGERALTFAVGQGRRDVVELLLARGARFDFVDQYGYAPVGLAAMYGRTEVAKLLLARGAKLDTPEGRAATLLNVASLNGDLPTATLLLEHGANANAVSKEGVPPLIAAVMSGSVPVARKLLDHGADAHATFEGHSAIDYARAGANWEMVKLLEARVRGSV